MDTRSEENVNPSDDENYESSLLICDELQRVIPDLFYYLSALKHLDNRFYSDARLAEVIDELLSLARLESLRIGNNAEDYVNRYRDQLVESLNKLQGFMSTLSDPTSLDADQTQQLLAILKHLFDGQAQIVEILGHS
ncbi:MAG: hypothetical protein H2069_00970 [Legionella sp.]|nr:hypothetical protein [Legionella sp.]